jgi:hypothetical protein
MNTATRNYLVQIDTDQGCLYFSSGLPIAVRGFEGGPDLSAANKVTPDDRAGLLAEALTSEAGEGWAVATLGCDAHVRFFFASAGDARDATANAIAHLEAAIEQVGGSKPKAYKRIEVGEIPHTPAQLNCTAQSWMEFMGGCGEWQRRIGKVA